MRRALLAAIVLAGCRTHLQAVVLPTDTGMCSWAPVYHDGEQLEFHITWHSIGLARLVDLSGDAGIADGRRAAMVELAVDGDGLVALVKELHDDMLSVVDLDRGVPLANNGTFEALFRGWGGDRRRSAPVVPWTMTAEGLPVQDVASGIALLRAWPADRKAGHLYLALGATSFRVDLTAAGVEDVPCLAHHCPALRLEGLVRDGSRPYRFTTWITTDDRHLPVRVVSETTSMGTVVMDLVRWAPGR